MAHFADRGFYKRAQIVPQRPRARRRRARSRDLDRLTIFADNLVPHVLRCDGVLVYDARLAAHIDGGALLPMDAREREIRAGAVHACELLAARLAVAPRALDTWLWNRGQGAEYKAPAAPPHADGLLLAGSPDALAAGRVRARAPAAAACTSASGSARRPASSATRLLELADARRRAPLIASAIGSGRWTQSASGPSGRAPSTRTGWPGLPTTVEFGGTSWMTTLLAPILAPWPIVIGPSSSAPEPIVTLSCTVGWRLPTREAGAAQRHALVERYVVADLRRLADHDARRRGR